MSYGLERASPAVFAVLEMWWMSDIKGKLPTLVCLPQIQYTCQRAGQLLVVHVDSVTAAIQHIAEMKIPEEQAKCSLCQWKRSGL
jgi:hypothetical protein